MIKTTKVGLCCLTAMLALSLACGGGSNTNTDAGSGGGSGGGTAGGGGGGGTGGGDGGTGGGSGGGTGSGYVTGSAAVTVYNDKCDDILGAFCDGQTRCGLFASAAGCVSVFGALVPNFCTADERASFSDSRAEISGSQADACFNAIRTTSACGAGAFPGDNIFAPECDTAIRGLVAGGGQCFNQNDCVPTAYCNFNAQCPGTCANKKAAGVAAMSSEECADPNAYIYDGKCAVPVAAGQSCAPVSPATNQRDCVAGNYCNGSNTCVALVAATGACVNDEDCVSGHECVNSTCQPLGGATAACDNPLANGQTVPGCKLDLYCDVAAVNDATGVCKVLEAAGGGCFFDNQCQSTLYCNGETLFPNPAKGTCATRPGTGGTCSTQIPCGKDLYCATNMCAAKKADGQACTGAAANDQCLSGNCDNGTCKPEDNCADPTP